MDNVIKCTVVGDGAVGKTSLIVSYTTGVFPEQYEPTVFDSYTVTLQVNNTSYHLNIFDTAGQEDYDRLRILSYPGTDVFLLCCSVSNPDSWQDAEEKWLPELQSECPNAPIILVGTKVDMRNKGEVKLGNRTVTPVEERAGHKLARRLGLRGYVECSALSGAGLKSVFDSAMKTVLCRPTPAVHRKTKKSSCCLL